MKLIQSLRVPLPIIYLLESTEELFKIPLGIPYIVGDKSHYNDYVKLLEYQILLSSARKTGFSFRWNRLLEENGFRLPKRETNDISVRASLDNDSHENPSYNVNAYLAKIDYIVDIEYLKSLHIIPEFFSDIENNIKSNLVNSIMYNPYLYNKKLDLFIGEAELNNQERNLITIDISGSIPKTVSKTILLLAKTMSVSFFADLLITGSKSTLYEYEKVHTLDINKIYDENGTDNDQIWFKRLLSQSRKYNTVIVFGDNDNPCTGWNNSFNNKGGRDNPFNDSSRYMSVEEGINLNQWDVKKVLSLHTCNQTSDNVAGYARWFKKDLIEVIKKEWVKYLD